MYVHVYSVDVYTKVMKLSNYIAILQLILSPPHLANRIIIIAIFLFIYMCKCAYIVHVYVDILTVFFYLAVWWFWFQTIKLKVTT